MALITVENLYLDCQSHVEFLILSAVAGNLEFLILSAVAGNLI